MRDTAQKHPHAYEERSLAGYTFTMEPIIDADDYRVPPETSARHMGAAEWVQSHIYTTACIGAGILLIIGALVVKQHTPQPASTVQAWGGGGTLINASSYEAQNPVLAQLPATDAFNSNSISFLPIPITVSNTAPDTSDSFDLQSLIASITRTSGTNSANSSSVSDTSVATSYDFIPQGLISTPSPGRARTPDQQLLYEYANEAGSYVQVYEDSHRDTSPVLKDQIADRGNAQKGQAVKDIGIALKNVGLSLEHMDNIPSAVRSMNQALADGYIEIGTKLIVVPDARTDDAFIAAITSYNASVDAFVGKFVAVAQYLSLSGVVFSPTDPGSVFSFSGGGGL